MKTYTFPAVVERDEDRWFAYCPPLREQGGATWGDTRDEALANLEQVVRLVLESLIEHGESVPEGLEGSFNPATELGSLHSLIDGDQLFSAAEPDREGVGISAEARRVRISFIASRRPKSDSFGACWQWGHFRQSAEGNDRVVKRNGAKTT